LVTRTILGVIRLNRVLMHDNNAVKSANPRMKRLACNTLNAKITR
jgi:hypothetical protein